MRRIKVVWHVNQVLFYFLIREIICMSIKILYNSFMINCNTKIKLWHFSIIGMAVVTNTQFIAGKQYVSDLYSCQSCPDAHMSMTVSSGAYSCACASSFTRVGVSGIGEQSCVLTTLTNAKKDSVATASQVTYYDSGAAGKCMLFLL